MQIKQIDVFDFDGTIIKINSFRRISRDLCIRLARKKQMIPLIKLILLYLKRRLLILDHLTFKKQVTDIFEKSIPEQQKRYICQSVYENNINPEVIKELRKSENSLISTSAPFSYISRISFGTSASIISSLEPANTLPDPANYQQGKLNNILAFYSGKKVIIRNVYTDSRDDQPLIDAAENVYLVKAGNICIIKQK